MVSPIIEFNYDISCPFAYIASTRIEALAQRTGATLLWRPVLLGAIYRATAAPHGAAGSASDFFNPTKRSVTAKAMQRTLQRYGIKYKPPPQHPRKTVNALRLLYALGEEDRRRLTKLLFQAYWVDARDVSDDNELLLIAREGGIEFQGSVAEVHADSSVRTQLEKATAHAIDRGAFGVPGFWIPEIEWMNAAGTKMKGRLLWGQDRMHFVEATIRSLQQSSDWSQVPLLRNLMPRCMRQNKVSGKVRLEFWYDFSSPWAFLAWTQLQRLQRDFGPELEIIERPFLLGILFREIGAPNLPSSTLSPAKARWSHQDHEDWTNWWNAINVQEGQPDKRIDFCWADVFPIRTPVVLRVAMVEKATVPLLYRACWEQNINVSDETVLRQTLDAGGYNGADLIAEANSEGVRSRLRMATREAIDLGICGVPTFRIFRQNQTGKWEPDENIVWGQDEINVVYDLIAGWTPHESQESAELSHVQTVSAKI